MPIRQAGATVSGFLDESNNSRHEKYQNYDKNHTDKDPISHINDPADPPP